MIHHLHRIVKKERLKLRRTCVKEIKKHRIYLRFFRYPKKIKKARAAIKRLGTITGILMRDISRNLTEAQLSKHKEAFELYTKVINQGEFARDANSPDYKITFLRQKWPDVERFYWLDANVMGGRLVRFYMLRLTEKPYTTVLHIHLLWFEVQQFHLCTL